MPYYEFECPSCSIINETIMGIHEDNPTCSCGSKMKKIISTCAIIIPGSIGKKLKTRVNLDDELKRRGVSSPLFSSEREKDVARWALKKEGIK